MPPRGAVRRALLSGLLRSPIHPEWGLIVALGAVAGLHRNSFGQRVGLRLMQHCRRISLLKSACSHAGGLKRFRREYGTRVPALMYHHVGPALGLGALSVTPEAFAKQMQWLARRGYHPITASDWQAWCKEGKQLPPKPVLLTFDDGYADLARYAFPVLRFHQFTATVFVVSQFGGMNTWDRPTGLPTTPLLSAQQVGEWARMGIEFGSHSRTHCDLRKCTSAELETEVVGSADDLARILGQRPVSFAYPYGEYDEKVMQLVQRTYGIAFTVQEGLNDLGTGLHLQRRSMVLPHDSPLDLEYRLRFGGDLRSALKRRLHRN